MTNAKFHQSIHTTAQLVFTQAERDASGGFFLEATRVGQLMKLNLPTFISVKVEKYPQGFFDKMEKIFRVVQATNMESVNFVAYQLKDVVYQW